MVRSTRILVASATLIALCSVRAMAQTQIAMPDRPAADLAGSTEPNPLPGLPRPPDQPGSLLRPAPAESVYGCPQLEGRYFEKDPLLDPAELPHPGWLFDVELGIVGSHVVNHLGENVPGVAAVPMATLNYAVSPCFELGYRLPSGFGEVDVAYRFLRTEGSGSTTDPIAAPDATAALNSHLSINVGDLDYASHETSLGTNWGMKWRIGLRYADVLFDSQADEPLAAAAAHSGIFSRSIRNNFWGIGPHATLELNRRQNPWGLGWVGRLDSGLLFGKVHQRSAEVSTADVSTVTDFENPQQVPMLSGFLGLDWRPQCRPNLNILLGYTAEYWWNVGRLSDPDIYNGQSAGEVGSHGALLRLEYNY
ncbi:MAG: Lpg1974 family pore-forming outer membrane protein [Thermoguttaceae bacterium]